jgi:hypothetical protein
MKQRRHQPEASGAVGDLQQNHYTAFPSLSQALPDLSQVPIVPLLWGWPEVLAAIPLSRRTLTRLLAADEFVKPIRHIGKRPFWLPDHIRRWAAGDE